MAEGVQAVVRSAEVLGALARAGGEATLTELVARTSLPLTTVHRLLRTLVTTGLVRQSASRRYALGAYLAFLGEVASTRLAGWARPALAELVGETHETANLAMLDNDRVVYVAQMPSPHSMRMFTEVGNRVDAHCSGVGKALLSQLGETEAHALLARTGMRRMTETTVTDPDVLLEQLREVAQRGFAIDDEEREQGVRCVAAPVPAPGRRLAVSVSGPTGRIPLDRVEDLGALVRRAAGVLGTALSHDGDGE